MGGVADAVGGLVSGIFGGGKAPKVEQAKEIEQMSSTPTEADDSVKAASEEERRRRRAAAGTSGTLLTGGQGVSGAASTAKKTLLG